MRQRVMLDLFCGRLGWSKAFLARGWKVIAVDLVEPPEIPQGVEFVCSDVLAFWPQMYTPGLRFICASPPCEEFSVHGMKHFHKNPKYPTNGIRLFRHTYHVCKSLGIPFVIENVRAAQSFVGQALGHCGPYYLWGNAVPPILPQGIRKGISHGGDSFRNLTLEQRRERRKLFRHLQGSAKSEQRKAVTADAATIPPELANCVADYAERLLEQREARCQTQS